MGALGSLRKTLSALSNARGEGTSLNFVGAKSTSTNKPKPGHKASRHVSAVDQNLSSPKPRGGQSANEADTRFEYALRPPTAGEPVKQVEPKGMAKKALSMASKAAGVFGLGRGPSPKINAEWNPEPTNTPKPAPTVGLEGPGWFKSAFESGHARQDRKKAEAKLQAEVNPLMGVLHKLNNTETLDTQEHFAAQSSKYDQITNARESLIKDYDQKQLDKTKCEEFVRTKEEEVQKAIKALEDATKALRDHESTKCELVKKKETAELAQASRLVSQAALTAPNTASTSVPLYRLPNRTGEAGTTTLTRLETKYNKAADEATALIQKNLNTYRTVLQHPNLTISPEKRAAVVTAVEEMEKALVLGVEVGEKLLLARNAAPPDDVASATEALAAPPDDVARATLDLAEHISMMEEIRATLPDLAWAVKEQQTKRKGAEAALAFVNEELNILVGQRAQLAIVHPNQQASLDKATSDKEAAAREANTNRKHAIEAIVSNPPGFIKKPPEELRTAVARLAEHLDRLPNGLSEADAAKIKAERMPTPQVLELITRSVAHATTVPAPTDDDALAAKADPALAAKVLESLMNCSFADLVPREKKESSLSKEAVATVHLLSNMPGGNELLQRITAPGDTVANRDLVDAVSVYFRAEQALVGHTTADNGATATRLRKALKAAQRQAHPAAESPPKLKPIEKLAFHGVRNGLTSVGEGSLYDVANSALNKFLTTAVPLGAHSLGTDAAAAVKLPSPESELSRHLSDVSKDLGTMLHHELLAARKANLLATNTRQVRAISPALMQARALLAYIDKHGGRTNRLDTLEIDEKAWKKINRLSSAQVKAENRQRFQRNTAMDEALAEMEAKGLAPGKDTDIAKNVAKVQAEGAKRYSEPPALDAYMKEIGLSKGKSVHDVLRGLHKALGGQPIEVPPEPATQATNNEAVSVDRALSTVNKSQEQHETDQLTASLSNIEPKVDDVVDTLQQSEDDQSPESPSNSAHGLRTGMSLDGDKSFFAEPATQATNNEAVSVDPALSTVNKSQEQHETDQLTASLPSRELASETGDYPDAQEPALQSHNDVNDVNDTLGQSQDDQFPESPSNRAPASDTVEPSAAQEPSVTWAAAPQSEIQWASPRDGSNSTAGPLHGNTDTTNIQHAPISRPITNESDAKLAPTRDETPDAKLAPTRDETSGATGALFDTKATGGASADWRDALEGPTAPAHLNAATKDPLVQVAETLVKAEVQQKKCDAAKVDTPAKAQEQQEKPDAVIGDTPDQRLKHLNDWITQTLDAALGSVEIATGTQKGLSLPTGFIGLAHALATGGTASLQPELEFMKSERETVRVSRDALGIQISMGITNENQKNVGLRGAVGVLIGSPLATGGGANWGHDWSTTTRRDTVVLRLPKFDGKTQADLTKDFAAVLTTMVGWQQIKDNDGHQIYSNSLDALLAQHPRLSVNTVAHSEVKSSSRSSGVAAFVSAGIPVGEASLGGGPFVGVQTTRTREKASSTQGSGTQTFKTVSKKNQHDVKMTVGAGVAVSGMIIGGGSTSLTSRGRPGLATKTDALTRNSAEASFAIVRFPDGSNKADRSVEYSSFEKFEAMVQPNRDKWVLFAVKENTWPDHYTDGDKRYSCEKQFDEFMANARETLGNGTATVQENMDVKAEVSAVMDANRGLAQLARMQGREADAVALELTNQALLEEKSSYQPYRMKVIMRSSAKTGKGVNLAAVFMTTKDAKAHRSFDLFPRLIPSSPADLAAMSGGR